MHQVKDRGTLFVDEAHRLQPKTQNEGRQIANEILVQTENNRASLTVIIAGYKDDIQKELYEYDPGFRSRFPIGKPLTFISSCMLQEQ